MGGFYSVARARPSDVMSRSGVTAGVERPLPWWDASVHADRRPFLLARGRIKAAIRAWFEARDFVEVETSALQVSPGNEAHLHAFATRLVDTAGEQSVLYLHTSPEFACKKLLAAGERRIFTLAPVFRNRERGALHHPEFTMLEWYRAGEPYECVMQDAVELLAVAARAANTSRFAWRGRAADTNAAPDRMTVAQAFARFAGIDDLLATAGRRDALARVANRAGVRVAADDTWSDIFSRVLTALVEPGLAKLGTPVLLTEYPSSEAALARPKTSDPRVAERFELYACGVELANGFGELTDLGMQRTRFEAEMTEKQRVYSERYPIDEDFLDALSRMPEASGCALGFDRLVMLATGAERIEQVTWTPVAERGTGVS